VLTHLRVNHPNLVEPAEKAFSCFDPYERESQSYAYSTLVLGADCEREVMGVLRSLLENRITRDHEDPESHFDAEMNARAAVDAERYYKAMVRGDGESWNVRDTHMMDTLDLLMEHAGPGAKGIVWAHNTHIGDASATDMFEAGMTNIGQLCRERHPGETYLVGFGSYEGGVIAGDSWGASMERMLVPKAREGSWEHVLHEAFGGDGLLLMEPLRGHATLEPRRGHRAIGVVYHPDRERYGNYVPTVIPRRYDAFLYVDRTDPLHPLHFPIAAAKEPPETYPFAI
jgi:erythromycin esterase-like protein